MASCDVVTLALIVEDCDEDDLCEDEWDGVAVTDAVAACVEVRERVRDGVEVTLGVRVYDCVAVDICVSLGVATCEDVLVLVRDCERVPD